MELAKVLLTWQDAVANTATFLRWLRPVSTFSDMLLQCAVWIG